MNAEINALITAYKKSFASKANNLEQYYQIKLSEEELKGLFLNVHKLAGSAKSYGYPVISEHASTLADMLKQKTFKCQQDIDKLLKILMHELRSSTQ